MRRSSVHPALAALLASVAISCGDGTGPERAEPPASLAAEGGAPLVGVAGAPLGSPLVVRVRDRFGNPVAGAAVAWAATAGGGTLAPAGPSGADGVATAAWTLGTEPADPQSATATVAGLAPVRFDALAATTMDALESGRTVPPGAVLTATVQLLTPSRTGVDGVVVTWSPSHGSVSSPTSITRQDGSSGLASVQWTLGAGDGPQTLTASAGALRATVTAEIRPPLASVQVVSGYGQLDTVGQTLPRPLVVRALDAAGRRLPGQKLVFVASRGGRVCAAAGTAGATGDGACVDTAVTDARGEASATWTLGTRFEVPTYAYHVYDVQQVEVRATDPVTGASRVYETFRASARPDAPVALVASNSTARSGVAGAPVGTPEVYAMDRYGNLVPDLPVTWAVTAGGGTLVPKHRSPDFRTVVFGAVWTLGTEPVVTQSATATVTGLPPVRFDALAATSMRATGGDGVTAPPGTAVNASVELRAVDGTPVGGVTVAWSAPLGAVSPGESRTDAQGSASTRWTLGGAPGQQSLTASAGPLRATLAATVVPGQNSGRALVAQLPGRVLDATAERVLWVDSTSGGPGHRVKVRDVAAGTDVVVARSDSLPAAASVAGGRLFTSGALFWSGTSSGGVFEWRAAAGALSEVGSYACGVCAPAVGGDWAAWRGAAGNVRRDLAAGATVGLGGEDGVFFSVAPNGDAAWLGSPSVKLWVYRNGAAAGRYPAGSTLGSHVETDGVNVAFISYADRYAYFARVMLERPDGDLELGRLGGAVPSFALAGGWVAFATDAAYRRSPAGEVAPLGFKDAKPIVRAVAAAGTTVLQATVGGAARYYLVNPAGSVADDGPAFAGERVVERGGRFFVIAGGAVYELGR